MVFVEELLKCLQSCSKCNLANIKVLRNGCSQNKSILTFTGLQKLHCRNNIRTLLLKQLQHCLNASKERLQFLYTDVCKGHKGKNHPICTADLQLVQSQHQVAIYGASCRLHIYCCCTHLMTASHWIISGTMAIVTNATYFTKRSFRNCHPMSRN